MNRVPDPSWKSGPPDPPQWTMHDHEFEEFYMVEYMDGYVYVYYDCIVDDGAPYNPVQCEASKTETYVLTGVVKKGQTEPVSFTLDELKNEYATTIDTRLVEEITERERHLHPSYEWGLLDTIEVEVEAHGDTFVCEFELEDEDISEW